MPNDPEQQQKVAQILIALRNARGLNQSDVAKATGFSQPYISKLENGLADYEGLPLRTIERLASILKFKKDDWQIILEGRLPQIFDSSKSENIDNNEKSEQLTQIMRHDIEMKEVYELDDAAKERSERRNLDIGPIPIHKSVLRLETDIFLANDNMTGSNLLPNDFLLIDMSINQAEEGGVFAVQVRSGAVELRRAQAIGEELWLFLDNGSKKIVPIVESDLKVLGRVYYSFRGMDID